MITIFGNGNTFTAANATYLLNTIASYTKGSYNVGNASVASQHFYGGNANQNYGVLSIRLDYMTASQAQLLQWVLNPLNGENYWLEWAGNLTLGCNSFLVYTGYYNATNNTAVNYTSSCPYNDTALIR